MDIIGIEKHNLLVRISSRELGIFCNSIFETIRELDWEMSARTGLEVDEAKEVLKKIKNINEGFNKEVTTQKIDVNFSEKEILLINNSLNEVTAGFHISDFENVIGTTKIEARQLLKKISEAFDKLSKYKNRSVGNQYFDYLR